MTFYALLQLATTLLPLAASFYLMYRSLVLPYWVTLLLAVPTGGLLIRTFVLMHDCAHGSFFRWRWANDTVGFVTGVLTLTPFAHWRRDHARHHATSGDLDRRGHGDVPTITLKEYRARSAFGRLRYRLFRHPLVMLGLGPLFVVLSQRIPGPSTRFFGPEGRSMIYANLGALAVFSAFAFWIGVVPVLAIYLPAMYIAAVGGVWLFYVQHQFEGTYWKDHEKWDYATAAIRGSSHLRLPTVLRWITASIGLHHVHHLSPRIPNYNLKRCHDENALFEQATELTLLQSVKTFRLALWDEDAQELVPFSAA